MVFTETIREPFLAKIREKFCVFFFNFLPCIIFSQLLADESKISIKWPEMRVVFVNFLP